jgi:uncharacterized protein (TIGR03000 family)
MNRTFRPAAFAAAALLAVALSAGLAQAQVYSRVGTYYAPSSGGLSFTPTQNYYAVPASSSFNGFAPRYYSSYLTGGQPTYLTSINYPTIYGAYGYQYAPGRMTFGATQPSYTTAPTIYGVYLPETTSYLTVDRPILDAAASPMETTATINVHVPADAALTFQGVRTTQTGELRRFQSPALVPGTVYSYDIVATWNDSGREVTKSRHVAIRAGDHLTVDFLAPEENTSELRTRELR